MIEKRNVMDSNKISRSTNSSYMQIGGVNWNFSDKIYYKLTGHVVESNYRPIISIYVKKLPKIIPNKNLFGLFWNIPTFKDTDSNYLFHIYDKEDFDYVVSTSSGNTVEGMARAIKNFNKTRNKNIYAILLVPQVSAYKVSKRVIESNPYVKYIVIKNSTLDDVRNIAKKLIKRLSYNYRVISATNNIKTAAYAQIGLVLNKYNLMNSDACYVQTVSGGVGPAGLIESAYQLNKNPEIIIVQPFNGKSTPIVDALNTHSQGKDPLSIFNHGNYGISSIEPTLGSSRPIYAINKFVRWRESGGRILPTRVTEEEIYQYRNKILNVLIKEKIYPNKEIGLKLFNLEKSGFIAFIGAICSAKNVKAENIIVNFTGRYLDPNLTVPSAAIPNIYHYPTDNLKELLRKLNI
ncbi:MAG: hypothetical protein ACFFBI_12845 [Promethearchaeota archaeon]